MLLKALFAIAWLTAIVPLVMSVLLLSYGSITRELGYWLVALVVSGLLLWAAHKLAAKGRTIAAGVLLAILAAPVVLACLVWLALVIDPPRWN